MSDMYMEGFVDGREHLLAELQRLDLMLRRQVVRLRAAHQFTEDELRGLYIPDAQVDAILGETIAPVPGHEPGDSAPAHESCDADPLEAMVARVRAENQERERVSLQQGIDLPLPRLARVFGLSPLERDALLICAALELEARYETLYAYVQNDVTRKYPTVDLVLKLLCATPEQRLAQRRMFAADQPLFRHHLLYFSDEQADREAPLLSRFVHTDRRVADYLLGCDGIDDRLSLFSQWITPKRTLDDLALPRALIDRLAHADQFFGDEGQGVLLFHGPYGVGKRAAAEAICATMGRPLLVADLAHIRARELPLDGSLALLRREAMLKHGALYLDRLAHLVDDDAPAARKGLALLVYELAHPTVPVFLGSERAWHPADLWAETDFLAFDFPLPEYAARLRLWEQKLHGDGYRPAPGVDLTALANKFVLSPGQIQDAARRAENLTTVRAADQYRITDHDLYAAARAQSNQGLRQLAQKMTPVYAWADIVLPSRPMQQLREVYASIKYRHVVYSQWGFERKLALGKGINALFAGPSGTGKTMAAQILAYELNLDIYKINLSSVVSKYIGETEKNLDRIFKEAQHSNAILFFDEADALFGKRSEVRDAHDRYANIEVAYLLQKMEEHDGIAILATNLRKNIDQAFTRRLRHIVEFPFPDEEHRRLIWEKVFPGRAPLADDVSFVFLAQRFDLAGGNIRNISLAAAFMAADDGGEISMEHLILATARELHKMGRLPSQAEFREYYELIRERG